MKTEFRPIVQHVALAEREPLDSAMDRALVLGRKDEGARGEYHEKMKKRFEDGLSQSFLEGQSSKKGTRGSRPLNPANLVGTPPGLLDPLIEETRIWESMLGCQTDVTAKAEGRLHPRYKQMKDERPFEGTVSDKSSHDLSDQKRLSILSWNAGPMREEVTNSMVV